MRHALSKGMLVTAAAASGILSLNGSPAFAAAADSVAADSPGILSGNNVQASVDVPVNVCGNSVNVAGLGNPAFADGCANGGAGGDGGNGSSGPREAGGTDGARPHQDHGRERGQDDGRTTAPEHAAPAPGHPAPGRYGWYADEPLRDGQRPPAHAAHSATGPEARSRHSETREYRGRHAAPRRDGRARHAKHSGGSVARGAATGSPGVLSGNLLQAPVDVPVNLCGNTVDVVALLNPVFGNECANAPKPSAPHLRPAPRPLVPQEPAPREEGSDGSRAGRFGTEDVPAARPAAYASPRAVPAQPRLAETGAGAGVLVAGVASAALLAGGAILYRRGSRAARR